MKQKKLVKWLLLLILGTALIYLFAPKPLCDNEKRNVNKTVSCLTNNHGRHFHGVG